ncbi:hypothetical protein E0L36_17010 [Streptomyces sp. AJS327]|uniref:hypothetical protein n=1 Tax=Streptomyces sp. AJS327 TaxID=2545265 RepID=UPI0015DFA3F7|nr:hypothetical protein [Streptomyces sp. AJS327]MBA0052521.1 hypothetical protein [Streptomyces sp. AJS327]
MTTAPPDGFPAPTTPVSPPTPTVRFVTMGEAAPGQLAAEWATRATSLDLYQLSAATLRGCMGVSLVGGCDQVFLSRTDALTDFVRGGGRVLVNGHVRLPFLPGLGRWRRLDFRGPSDLRISPVTPHPVWEGVDYDELLYRTGGSAAGATGDRLAETGVAGFYGRGYHGELPPDATVLNGIGPHRLPIDIHYRLGDGEVLAHAGNDLTIFADPDRSTRRLGERLLDWLEGR